MRSRAHCPSPCLLCVNWHTLPAALRWWVVAAVLLPRLVAQQQLQHVLLVGAEAVALVDSLSLSLCVSLSLASGLGGAGARHLCCGAVSGDGMQNSSCRSSCSAEHASPPPPSRDATSEWLRRSFCTASGSAELSDTLHSCGGAGSSSSCRCSTRGVRHTRNFGLDCGASGVGAWLEIPSCIGSAQNGCACGATDVGDGDGLWLATRTRSGGGLQSGDARGRRDLASERGLSHVKCEVRIVLLGLTYEQVLLYPA